MGYGIEQLDCEWFIAKKNTKKAALALRKWARAKDEIPWSCIKAISSAKELDGIMQELRFTSHYNKNGDVIYFQFEGENTGCEDEVFKVLAPYSRPGSYMKFRGEDGCLFGFKASIDGELIGMTGEIVWDCDYE
jgi:hypothetical protein